MSNLHFFDCVKKTLPSFGNLFEDYFYLDSISNKVGCRKFSYVTGKQNEIVEEKKHTSNWKSVSLNVVKVVSYLTLIIPAIMLIGKAINREVNHFQDLHEIENPTAKKTDEVCQKVIADTDEVDDFGDDVALPKSNATIARTAPPKTSPENRIDNSKTNISSNEDPKEWLEEQWTQYKETLPPDEVFLIALRKVRDEKEARSDAATAPDTGFAIQIIEECRNFPNVTYAVREGFASTGKKDYTKDLVEWLRMSFAAGNKLLVCVGNARGAFSIHNHALAFACTSDGNFRFVDSMMSSSENVKYITKLLNKAQIRDASGKVIHFKGDQVCTNIQRGGHDCARFATLYAYQMAKKCSLDAFEEVNGAFLSGKLKTFEDYANIDGKTKVRDVGGKVKAEDYESFMKSWVYRSQGLKVDRWEDLTIPEVLQRTQITGNFGYYSFAKGKFPDYMSNVCSDVEGERMNFWYEDGHGTKKQIRTLEDIKNIPLETKALPADLTKVTLESLFPNDDRKHLLFFEKDKPQPILCVLPPGAKFYRELL